MPMMVLKRLTYSQTQNQACASPLRENVHSLNEASCEVDLSGGHGKTIPDGTVVSVVERAISVIDPFNPKALI